MSGENWEKETNNLPDGDKNEKESYQFMDQVIKKKNYRLKPKDLDSKTYTLLVDKITR